MLKHAYEDARDDWKIAVEMGTKHMAGAQEQLGTFLHLQGDMEGSLDCYNTALEIKVLRHPLHALLCFSWAASPWRPVWCVVAGCRVACG